VTAEFFWMHKQWVYHDPAGDEDSLKKERCNLNQKTKKNICRGNYQNKSSPRSGKQLLLQETPNRPDTEKR
jgi:hypothetical protein